ncbi:MAG: 4Fe-4S dicluster domain-containing protein [Candidatus Gastranaerophilales bacterium]|nr:4Fe-4S dicluster domain-containing protein [Candidatus Gastranaerophilales bacterium]
MKKTDTELISDFIKGVASTLVSIFTVLSCAFKKRATLLYPEVKPEIPDNFRGKIEIDTEKCIGCGLCTKLCPAFGTLALKETKKGKKLAVVDISRCIFCGNCAYNCPKGAINLTKQYELATDAKKDLILNTEDK